MKAEFSALFAPPTLPCIQRTSLGLDACYQWGTQTGGHVEQVEIYLAHRLQSSLSPEVTPNAQRSGVSKVTTAWNQKTDT
jgi:hypothetical protein